MTLQIALRRGRLEDVPFVMATERLPGYEQLVGRWEQPAHVAALGDDRFAYFIGSTNGTDAAFAIVQDLGSPQGAAHIRRLAVADPGLGVGSAFTRGLVDAVFAGSDTHRLSIGTFPENERARRAYEKAGFVAEGVARGGALFNGVRRDELILSLLRPEWEAGRSAG
jgi:RimJ/RimL family protein N-acetyltransferase